jgi:hypothetical protein
MRLSEDDITRLIRACETYKDQTGSEYIWEIYDQLECKLKMYTEQMLTTDAN